MTANQIKELLFEQLNKAKKIMHPDTRRILSESYTNLLLQISNIELKESASTKDESEKYAYFAYPNIFEPLYGKIVTVYPTNGVGFAATIGVLEESDGKHIRLSKPMAAYGQYRDTIYADTDVLPLDKIDYITVNEPTKVQQYKEKTNT